MAEVIMAKSKKLTLCRLFPLLMPILALLFFEIIYCNPTSIYILSFILLFLFFVSIRLLIKTSGAPQKTINFIILPALFTVSQVGFVVLIPNSTTLETVFIQLLFVINVIFLYYYYKIIYYYLFNSEFYKEYSLENISAYGNFLTVFFISSFFYGLLSFLDLSIWILIIFLLFFISLVIYQTMWVNKIERQIGIFYVLILSIVLTEIAWSLSFLPQSFYILGLVLSICYYILIGLTKYYLIGNLDSKIIKYYLIFGFFSVLIIFLSSQWVSSN